MSMHEASPRLIDFTTQDWLCFRIFSFRRVPGEHILILGSSAKSIAITLASRLRRGARCSATTLASPLRRGGLLSCGAIRCSS
jgi:hypothetical protein